MALIDRLEIETKNHPQELQITSSFTLPVWLTHDHFLWEEVKQEVIRMWNNSIFTPWKSVVSLINAPILRVGQAQIADPALAQIWDRCNNSCKDINVRQHQLISVLCWHNNISMVTTLKWPEVIKQLLKNMLYFKHNKVVVSIHFRN